MTAESRLSGTDLFLAKTPCGTESDGHLHNAYIVLGTINCPDIVQNAQIGVLRLCSNTFILGKGLKHHILLSAMALPNSLLQALKGSCTVLLFLILDGLLQMKNLYKCTLFCGITNHLLPQTSNISFLLIRYYLSFDNFVYVHSTTQSYHNPLPTPFEAFNITFFSQLQVLFFILKN